MKLELPNVSLICLTNRDFKGHKEALDKSSVGIEWGAKKIIWDESITGIDSWNYKMIYELTDYVQTEFAMVIHADGYVTRPDLWKEGFLQYDYIGAPWPLPKDNYSYLTPKGELIRVGNSVSIRSKKLLDLPRQLGLEWKPYYGNTNEDGFLCVHSRDRLIEHSITFAPIHIAKFFSREHEIEENKGLETFAFHSII